VYDPQTTCLQAKRSEGFESFTSYSISMPVFACNFGNFSLFFSQYSWLARFTPQHVVLSLALVYPHVRWNSSFSSISRKLLSHLIFISFFSGACLQFWVRLPFKTILFYEVWVSCMKMYFYLIEALLRLVRCC